ncbi:hypothetical protein LJC05_02670 [Bacteroides sp. OttesenSCG-928-J23]|nr:hypothetical protein [Bacteroides sp. OttesenSCG-928-J23]
MINPSEILKRQILDFSRRASQNESKEIVLSKNEMEAFRYNFSMLCFSVKRGRLDEIYQMFFNKERQDSMLYSELDLNNILMIIKEVEVAD